MERNKNNIKVSIIVPVYNAEQYIEECIKSALNQSLKELELIMIDDGSTDDSCSIINKFMKEDERVILLKENHQGSGPARNLGLEKARGEYIVFLDADDFLYDGNALEYMYDQGKAYGAAICASYRMRLTNRGFEENNYLNIRESPTESKWMRFGEVQNDWFYQSYIFSRRFLRDNEIKFPAYLRGQDPPFLLAAMKQARKFLLCPVKMYCYRWGHQGKDFSEKQVLDMLKGMYDVLKTSLELHYYKLVEKVLQRLDSSGYYYQFVKKYPSEDIVKQLFAISDLLISQGFTGRLKILEEREFRKHNKVKISVIIPVYNVGEYLEDCLKSVCGQNFDGFEIICVDDGSTDGSYEILKEYEAKEDRLHVFYKENGGLSSARNYGIRKARGSYMVFVDSDDVLCTEKALSLIWDKIDENDLDVLFYDSELIFSMEPEDKVKKERIKYFTRKKEYGLYDKACDLFADFVANNDYIATAWGACVRKQILSDFHVSFPMGRLNEDEIYMFYLILKAGRAMHIKERLYGYRQRPDSIMYQKITCDRVADSVCTLLEMQHLYKSKKWPEHVSEAIKKRISIQKWHVDDYYKHVNADKVIDDALSAEKRYILDTYFDNAKNNNCDKKDVFQLLPQGRPKAFWGTDKSAWIAARQAGILPKISQGDFIVVSDSVSLGCFFHGMPICNVETLLHCAVKPLVLVQEEDYVAVAKKMVAYGFVPGVDILAI